MPQNLAPRATASIDLSALRHNLQRVSQLHPGVGLVAVIKANAYGHGMGDVARYLGREAGLADVMAVATLAEVVELQQQLAGRRLLLLGGYRNRDELEFLLQSGIEFVLHADHQLALLKDQLARNPRTPPFSVWLKIDTGMHRLGFAPADVADVLKFLVNCPQARRIVVMSHLACMDTDDRKSEAITARQLQSFQDQVDNARALQDNRLQFSLCASAGILRRTDLGYDYVRPGIMMYGGSPFAGQSAAALGLRPVMTLSAGIIAIRDLAAGESIGYGATFTCDRQTRVGVVSIGYADGYPRSAGNGTPVLVETAAGWQRTGLIGRVSMDMITIDLTGLADCQPGSRVVLWGQGLAADEVAAAAGTISYDLFCRVTRRVNFTYV